MYTHSIARFLLQPMPLLNRWISHFSIDSREIKKGSLFFALEGNRVSGASFLSEVAQKGGVAAIVPKMYQGASYGLHLFFVDNVILALQKLAQEKIHAISNAHVIAITGSIGKTTSKEYLFAILQNHFSVFHTPKNYNSQIGLPLSLLNAPSDRQVYIIEIGMSEKGNIQQLVRIVPPTIAWVTQISHSHFSNFSSLEEIAQEKAHLFSSPKLQYRIIHRDISHYDCMQSGAKNTLIYGKDVELLSKNIGLPPRCYEELTNFFSVQTCGKHLLDNFLGAVTIAKILGLSFQDIFASITTLPVVPHRFQKKSYKGITFIDDSYNANADSTIAALHNLPTTSGRKILVFADMHELGSYTEKAHERVALAAASVTDACFCLGESSKVITDLFISRGKAGYHFTDRGLMTDSLVKYIKKGDVVLVKGANQYRLWEIILQISTSNSYLFPFSKYCLLSINGTTRFDMSEEEKEIYKKAQEYQKKIDNIEWEHFPFKDIPGIPPNMFKSSLNIMEFIELFLNSSYSRERLPTLCGYFGDFYTQLLMIKHAALPLSNYYIQNIKPNKSQDTQDLYEVFFLQAFIVAARILFERMMNFIYFLEKGEELEKVIKKSDKSKKAIFFKSIVNTPWEFLITFRDFIEQFDNILRTPEVHKHSRLNKQFRENTISNFKNPIISDVLYIFNKVENEILKNIKLILQGQPATHRYEEISSDENSLLFKSHDEKTLK